MFCENQTKSTTTKLTPSFGKSSVNFEVFFRLQLKETARAPIYTKAQIGYWKI